MSGITPVECLFKETEMRKHPYNWEKNSIEMQGCYQEDECTHARVLGKRHGQVFELSGMVPY